MIEDQNKENGIFSIDSIKTFNILLCKFLKNYLVMEGGMMKKGLKQENGMI